MEPDFYPLESVRSLLDTPLVTTKTSEVLRHRLEASPEVNLFDSHQLAILRGITSRFFPQLQRRQDIDPAKDLEVRLLSGVADGWRYDDMPPDLEAHHIGLAGIDESARLLFGSGFCSLDGASQDALLYKVQAAKAPGSTWEKLPARRYFEELLTELTEYFYSHPDIQSEIGYAGMADARGWQQIGLNEREPWEPVPGVQPTIPQAKRESLTPKLPIPSSSAHREELVDVVVVGTGAGGAPLLARLAQAGFKVVALEAGNHWNPATDFATDEREQNKLFWADERLSAGADPLGFGRNNSGIGVGGSTLHYTAYVPRPQPDDFQLFTDFGVGEDWPIGYADLEPYFDEVEHFLGVSGSSPYPWGPARTPYPLAPLPLNAAAQLMERGCDLLGIRTAPAANAALSAPYFQPGIGWRNPCTNRGFCQAGCTTGGKASMDVTFIPLALAHGAEIRSGAFVTRIETDKEGHITGVVYIRDGKEERQRCRALFLAAGAIETPRLLLLNGLANQSGEVGRNFMAHPGLQIWGTFSEATRPFKGIPGGLISEDTHRPKDANFAGGYLLQSIGVMPVTYASQVARGCGLWGENLQSHMNGYNHTAGINILGECLPYSHNYLELSDELDQRGFPKPRIHFSNGENEQRMRNHAQSLMRRIWEAAGAKEIWAFERNAHTIGTCRMGTAPSRAVVDSESRAFDVPNLYIIDNSVFPSALSVNPALILMALSLRTADRFIERTKRGES
ncbi:MAG: GMC family oxidoreductase N-terminal domain-containing protein [Anaerolineae bacterium]|nr:GMC family oxidoreductase N-terminal domain-containing protein [Gloeobacterales cyanobacterium ES-bin-313]